MHSSELKVNSSLLPDLLVSPSSQLSIDPTASSLSGSGSFRLPIIQMGRLSPKKGRSHNEGDRAGPGS